MTAIKRILVVIGALVALPALTATTASATPVSGTVKAVTHASSHPDTCACTTTTLSPNGYVWAYDNLSRQFTVTDDGGGSYTVVVTDHGSFSAFAEPNNADLSTFYPIKATGSIDGTYILSVQATAAPVASGLPPQVPGDVATSAMVQMLFRGSATTITGGAYTYTYTYTYTYKADGDTYTQSSQPPYITGDITG